MTPKQKFLKSTSEFYISKGYKFLKKDEKFIKTENDWKFGFIFDFTKWSDGTYVKMFLFADYIPLRKFYKKIIPDDMGYGIVGAEAGLVLGNSDFEITNEKSEIVYPLRDETEIINAVSQFEHIYLSKLEQYFNRVCDLKYVDKIYNDKPLSFNTSNYSDPGRLCTALILAKLVNRNDYNYLEKVYSDEMIDNDYGIYENEFIEIREALKNNVA